MPHLEDGKFLDRHVEPIVEDVVQLEASAYIRRKTGDGFPDDIYQHCRNHLRSVLYRARQQGREELFIREVREKVSQLRNLR